MAFPARAPAAAPPAAAAAAAAAGAAVGGYSLQVAEGVFSTLSGVIGASTADKNTTFPISDMAIAASLSCRLTGCVAEINYPRIAMGEAKGDTDAADENLKQAVRALFRIQRQAAAAAQAAEDLAKRNDLGGGSGGGAPTPRAQRPEPLSQTRFRQS
jgi:hypothetical protein